MSSGTIAILRADVIYYSFAKLSFHYILSQRLNSIMLKLRHSAYFSLVIWVQMQTMQAQYESSYENIFCDAKD